MTTTSLYNHSKGTTFNENVTKIDQSKNVELYLRRLYSDFNTVFVPLLLLAAGVGFPAACF